MIFNLSRGDKKMDARINHICPNWIWILALLPVVILALPVMAADETGFALLLQSSPVNGGSIVPGNGVHRMQIGRSVPLTAVPQRGYRFLYWIGDVEQTDRIRTRTTVRMDGPKLVIAVFERERFEDLLDSGIVSGSATGGLHQSLNPLTGSGGVNPASPSPKYPSGSPTPPTPPESDDFPVPNEIPEPTTILLLGMGVITARRMQK